MTFLMIVVSKFWALLLSRGNLAWLKYADKHGFLTLLGMSMASN